MTKNATVQYRYVNLDRLGEHFHLKNVVVDVLRRSAKGATGSRAELVRHRKIDLDQDGSYVVLNKMNDTTHWNGPIFCGQLLHIRAGADVAGIMQSLEEDISELELRNITMGGDQRVVDGVLYFAIVHNHVGLIEGQRARSRTLERYLTRLLQDSTELEPGQTVILNAKLQGGSTVNDVSELFVSPERSTREDMVDTTSQRGAGVAEGQGTTVFDVLETLGWTHDEIESLQAGLPEEGWIEGTFKMVFKQKAKKRATRAAIARKQLEEALRNHHPASIGLRDLTGSTEKRGLARLAEKRDVATIQDLLDPEDAMRVIVGLLRSWATSGKIDCDFHT